MSKSPSNLPVPSFDDPKHHLRIYQGDCLEILSSIPENSVDLVFADQPYFLSNGGITCHAGKMVSVNKGAWDVSKGPDSNHAFNTAWLAACQRVLKPNGGIWVSGTSHVIHSVGFAMQQLGFKLLNDISWVKPNPPPNLSCRYFTHATDPLIGGGTTLLTAFRLRRHALGCELSAEFLSLSLRRICSNLVQVDLSLTCVQFSLDPFPDPMDRSKCDVAPHGFCSGRFTRPSSAGEQRSSAQMSPHLQLVQQERRFYFIGRNKREVIFAVLAESLDEARQKFRASGRPDSDALFIIKTETEIYLAFMQLAGPKYTSMHESTIERPS